MKLRLLFLSVLGALAMGVIAGCATEGDVSTVTTNGSTDEPEATSPGDRRPGPPPDRAGAGFDW